MHKWVALMDEYGRELDHDGYARQRVNYPASPDWDIYQFPVYPGPEPVIVAGVWLCDSETSRMRDGIWHPLVKTLKRGEHFNFHLRGEREELIDVAS